MICFIIICRWRMEYSFYSTIILDHNKRCSVRFLVLRNFALVKRKVLYSEKITHTLRLFHVSWSIENDRGWKKSWSREMISFRILKSVNFPLYLKKIVKSLWSSLTHIRFLQVKQKEFKRNFELLNLYKCYLLTPFSILWDGWCQMSNNFSIFPKTSA